MNIEDLEKIVTNTELWIIADIVPDWFKHYKEKSKMIPKTHSCSSDKIRSDTRLDYKLLGQYLDQGYTVLLRNSQQSGILILEVPDEFEVRQDFKKHFNFSLQLEIDRVFSFLFNK